MISPAKEGFYQPAEWAPHTACWVAWPSHPELWKEQLEEARVCFVAMCRTIADPDSKTGVCRGERLSVLVPTEAAETAARAALKGLAADFHRVAFGDIWLRDTAPLFLRRQDGAVALVRFSFNGWGGKFVLPEDDRVAERVAEASGLHGYRFPFILEGGSVEPDGEGTLLTTRQCLLNPNRNPGMDPKAMEAALAMALGSSKVLWLNEGLLNDHTDGHIDTIARFVAPGKVVCMRPSGANDPNEAVLKAIGKDLAALVDAKGRRLQVVQIPSPGRVLDDAGKVMAASYVNFYIANKTVVVPTFGSRWDEDAVTSIAGLFPGRRTVGVPARALLTGGGAFHCITQQQPGAPA